MAVAGLWASGVWAPAAHSGTGYSFEPNNTPQGGQNGGTLINNTTGQRTSVPAAPGCDYLVGDPLVGSTWLVFNCGARGLSTALPLDVHAYAIPNGPWRTVVIHKSIRRQCDATSYPGSCSVVGVATDSIKIDIRCYHCQDAYFDQPIAPPSATSP
jgi:hypothetical protein